MRGFARCRNASGLCRAASSVSARLQNVVLLASKAAWQLARVKRSASLASALRHTLPGRACVACRCRECAATQGTPKTFVVKEADRNIGDGGVCGVISSIDMYNNDVGKESAQKFMKQTGDLKAATLYFAS